MALSAEEAVAAVAGQDTATLLELLERHHVRMHGHVSPEAIRKYRLGARIWLEYAANQTVKVPHPDGEDTDLWVRSLE